MDVIQIISYVLIYLVIGGIVTHVDMVSGIPLEGGEIVAYWLLWLPISIIQVVVSGVCGILWVFKQVIMRIGS